MYKYKLNHGEQTILVLDEDDNVLLRKRFEFGTNEFGQEIGRLTVEPGQEELLLPIADAPPVWILSGGVS